MKKSKPMWSIYFFLYIVFFLSQPYDLLWSVHEPYKVDPTVGFTVRSSQEGSIQRRIALISLCLFIFSCILRRRYRRLNINGVLGWAIIFFLVWTSLSIFWSSDPAMTVRKDVVLIIIGLGALAISQCLSLLQIMFFIIFSGTLTLILGVLSEVFLGLFSPFRAEYRFGGITHPTFQGWSLGLLFLASFFLSKKYRSKRFIYYSLELVSFIFLILTKARGPVWGVLITIIVYVLYTTSRPRKLALVYLAIFSALILVFMYVSIFGEQIIDFMSNIIILGREKGATVTLTGRLPLWQQTIPFIGHRPFNGYGYETFWTSDNLTTFAKAQGWALPDAHSGYVNMLLGIGIIGLFVYILILALGISRSLSVYKINGKTEYLFACMSIVFLIMNIVVVGGQLEPYLTSFAHLAIIAKIGFSRIT
ncbi:hypothetical protein A2V80_03120 [Candidatus Woesebacteria bacterium RBG_16_39_8b]|uniref:O-antigen ligase-related domain-containing protein n=1 Tax=Candidatus Woesebacteria bacterium RBG_16_39_8b TaxID=1802482 RepID=A0A1F7XC79_9BACT|nr:MAG: hypothetical protein A2V80_03120 [Candidatus Woesebacteria bacterium RBG_16_39_8b]